MSVYPEVIRKPLVLMLNKELTIHLRLQSLQYFTILAEAFDSPFCKEITQFLSTSVSSSISIGGSFSSAQFKLSNCA